MFDVLTRRTTTLIAVGAVAAVVAAGCTSGGAATTTRAPSAATNGAAAAVVAAASPAESMMDDSPSPATATSAAPAAEASTAAMMGGFHGVDGTAAGTVELKKVGDGYVVVFEDFSIASADHTDVVLVENTDVTTTSGIDKAMILSLGPLKGTSGMQDYPVPAAASGGITRYHTVVLWDSAMGRAIAAAPLGG
jgi:hypothetical protein